MFCFYLSSMEEREVVLLFLLSLCESLYNKERLVVNIHWAFSTRPYLPIFSVTQKESTIISPFDRWANWGKERLRNYNHCNLSQFLAQSGSSLGSLSPYAASPGLSCLILMTSPTAVITDFKNSQSFLFIIYWSNFLYNFFYCI